MGGGNIYRRAKEMNRLQFVDIEIYIFGAVTDYLYSSGKPTPHTLFLLFYFMLVDCKTS